MTDIKRDSMALLSKNSFYLYFSIVVCTGCVIITRFGLSKHPVDRWLWLWLYGCIEQNARLWMAYSDKILSDMEPCLCLCVCFLWSVICKQLNKNTMGLCPIVAISHVSVGIGEGKNGWEIGETNRDWLSFYMLIFARGFLDVCFYWFLVKRTVIDFLCNITAKRK